MTEQITPISDIVDNAHRAAEAGFSPIACPYPADSAQADRWRIAFFAREKELRAEVEV